jgi:hypothetical protein
MIVLFGFFLLPDFGGTASVKSAYEKIKKAGPVDMFIPAPPIEKNRDKIDFDKIRFDEKIRMSLNDVDLLEKPELQQPNKVPIVPLPVPDYNKIHHNVEQSQHKKYLPTTNTDDILVYNVDGADTDPIARKRRDKVKEVSLRILNKLSD